MRKSFRKKAAAVMMAAAVLFTSVQTELAVYAKGPTYTAMQDVYYTKIIVLSMQSQAMNQPF